MNKHVFLCALQAIVLVNSPILGLDFNNTPRSLITKNDVYTVSPQKTAPESGNKNDHLISVIDPQVQASWNQSNFFEQFYCSNQNNTLSSNEMRDGNGCCYCCYNEEVAQNDWDDWSGGGGGGGGGGFGTGYSGFGLFGGGGGAAGGGGGSGSGGTDDGNTATPPTPPPVSAPEPRTWLILGTCLLFSVLILQWRKKLTKHQS